MHPKYTQKHQKLVYTFPKTFQTHMHHCCTMSTSNHLAKFKIAKSKPKTWFQLLFIEKIRVLHATKLEEYPTNPKHHAHKVKSQVAHKCGESHDSPKTPPNLAKIIKHTLQAFHNTPQPFLIPSKQKKVNCTIHPKHSHFAPNLILSFIILSWAVTTNPSSFESLNLQEIPRIKNSTL